jgi:hypothetical protein
MIDRDDTYVSPQHEWREAYDADVRKSYEDENKEEDSE